jgi:hypothetical protein
MVKEKSGNGRSKVRLLLHLQVRRQPRKQSLMKFKTFLLFLVLTASLYGLFHWLRPSADPFFASDLIALDTASVTLLSLIPEGRAEEELLLKREGRTWIASQGNRSVQAPASGVAAVLAPLTRLGSRQIAGRGAKDWEVYGVGPGQGIRVRVFQGAKQAEDFLVGLQEWDPDSLPFTYVRMWGDEAVFAAPGFLRDAFWPGFEAFRSKALLKLDAAKVRRLRWEPAHLDSALVFSWSDSGWIHPSGTVTPDLDSFLLRIRALEGADFADVFDPVAQSGTLMGRIVFSGTDWERPVEVRYYRDTLGSQPFVFSTSSNPDNFFYSDSAGLFRALILPLYSLSAGGGGSSEAAAQ